MMAPSIQTESLAEIDLAGDRIFRERFFYDPPKPKT